jgi:hypothetical protein
MKRFVLILVVLLALATGLLLAVNSMTSGMSRNADEFFLAARDRHIDTAMNYLSTGFRNSVTPSEFSAWLHAGGLDRFEASTWDSRSFSASQGEITGAILLDDGSVLPVNVVFVKEGEEWRIHSIDARFPGVSPRAPGKGIPSLNYLESLVSKTVAQFGSSTASGEFDGFYRSVSALWQSRTSPARLRQAFEPFVSGGVDLAELATARPVFSEPPRIDEEGRLHLVGYFPHESRELRFDLSYTFEYPEWKLLGLNVTL